MTMFSQDQVNQWFAANPTATPEQVAQTVQGLGGLDANQGLAGMIGQHYGTDANTITNNYNTLAAPATPATPVDYSALVNNAYSGIGRTGVGTDVKNIDQGGLDYWTGQLKSGALTPENFNSAFNNAVYTYAAANPTDKYTQYVQDYQTANPTTNQYFVNNPDVAAEYARNSQGMTPEQFATTHYNKFGVNEQRIDPNALSGVADLYKTYLGRAPESRTALDAWATQFGSTIDPEEVAAFRQAAAPELKNTGYLSDPFKNEAKSYINSILGDTTLSPQEQAATIMAKAKEAGLSQSQLEGIYGKGETNPYLDVYKTGINSFLTNTLAKEPGTTMNEVGEIHRAAQEFGLTPAEMAKYAGIDPKQAQAYFDQYNQGLGTIMSRLNDPKVDDLTKTQTALALASKYGATDAELAKASNGKYTEKDIAAYLDPVRNVPTNLQKLFDDPNATAKDIQKFISDAKLDPRAAGIYGAALDKMTSNPELYLRDAVNGKADVSDSYESFLSMAKSTPEMATKYAPQIQAIENAKNIIGKHALNKDFGGEYKDFAMEMFMGLDKNTQTQAPKKLELTAPKTKTVTEYGEFGDKIEREVVVPSELKDSKGVEAIRDEDGNVTGYTKLLDAKAFDETWPGQKERFGVRANYDANGNLTGYESGARVHVSDPQYFQAKWDANGSPRPTQGANQGGGFFKGVMQDVASMGPIGTIALMAATGGLGSLAAGALTSSLGAAAAQAVGSGLVSGVMSEMGGGNFGKGFVGGAVGSGAGQLAGSYMPTNVTGNTFIDSYLTKAAPNVASNMARTGFMGGDIGDAGLASLLNTGVGMGVDYGTNSLLGETGMDKLGAMQPYATGVASNLVSSALTGKDPNLEKALMSTMMQQAMSTGKQAVKTAGKP